MIGLDVIIAMCLGVLAATVYLDVKRAARERLARTQAVTPTAPTRGANR